MKLLAALSGLLCISCVSCLPSLNKIYSAWYCGDDSCLWAKYGLFVKLCIFSNSSCSTPTGNATWLINRGDGNPTFNIVVSLLLFYFIIFYLVHRYSHSLIQ